MMSATTAEDVGWPELQRARRAIVVVDVVESVRLMQQHETDVINRWRRFVNEVQTQVLPKHGGRLVKSLGDGMLLEFESVPSAITAALDMQRRVEPYNAGRDSAMAMHLRIGVHLADVVVDQLDIYGAGVNLTARLTTLARAGEVVVSSIVRDQLTQGLGIDIEDLGDCYFKHLDVAVHAFRLSSAHACFEGAETRAEDSLRPTVAVLPFTVHGEGEAPHVLSDVLVDDLIACLSRSGNWNVVSRLSTQALKGRAMPLPDVRRLLGASYVLTGSLRSRSARVRLSAELADTRSEHVLWADTMESSAGDLMFGDDETVSRVASAIGSAILGQEVTRATQLSLPTLEAYAILFRGISMMHHSTREIVLEAQRGLEYLIERHPRSPEARAWMAKCHVLRVAHEAGASAAEEAARARDHIRRALDIHPHHALAHAIDGLVQIFISRDLEGAEASYRRAIESNPNESLAWLFMSSVHAHRADGAQAMRCVERARRLSPLDPLDHYFNGFTAWAAIAGGDYEKAERHALRAMKTNCTHRPTFVTLTQAQALLGKHDAACGTAAKLLALAPNYSVSRYLAGFPGGETSFARMLADSLASAGVPQ